MIVAACIPTLRQFFHKAFGSKASLSGTGPSAARSGSAFKLASKLTNTGAQRLPSESDMQFDEIYHKGYDDGESHSSQHRIWRTTEFNVEGDSLGDLETDPVPEGRVRRVPQI